MSVATRVIMSVATRVMLGCVRIRIKVHIDRKKNSGELLWTLIIFVGTPSNLGERTKMPFTLCI